MIKLENINFSYQHKTILKDLSLEIPLGQINCLLGGSGSGKTTILRLISGLEVPQKGKILVNNVLYTDNQKLLIPPYERSIGYVFQDLALWPHFTVYKNIAFGLLEKGDKEVKEKVEFTLQFWGLSEFRDKYPHQLSGGQKQLVAISRSLVLQPKILLMDEPLANLDVKLKRQMLHHLQQLMTSDVYGNDLSIIYVTHDHKEAFHIGENIIVMNKGKVEMSGSVEEVKGSNNEFVQFFLEY